MNYLEDVKKIAGLIMVAFVVVLFGCKKDFIIGGKITDVNKYANVSTYEALKTMPQFDTLIQLIDAAGIKDQINSSGTFFAPAAASVLRYLSLRTKYLQDNVNIGKTFLLDSLEYYLKNNINHTKDSLLIYLVKEKLPPEVLTGAGTILPTGMANNKVNISFEETTDGNMGYTDIISTIPRLVYYTQLWEGDGTESESDDRVLVKSAFIKTQNGYIDALEQGHVLFFYGR